MKICYSLDHDPCHGTTAFKCAFCKSPACHKHSRITRMISDDVAQRYCLRCIESEWTCNVVDSNSCKQETRSSCFACGLPACVSCSLRVSYYRYGRKRLCHRCLEDYDGNDKRVLAHLHRLAGYEA